MERYNSNGRMAGFYGRDLPELHAPAGGAAGYRRFVARVRRWLGARERDEPDPVAPNAVLDDQGLALRGVYGANEDRTLHVPENLAVRLRGARERPLERARIPLGE